MAAPNLNNPTSVVGKTTYLALGSTSETDLLTNASASGKCLRVKTIILANVDGTNAVDATLKIYNAATSGTGYSLVSTVSVPADSSVVAIGSDNSVYLEEDRRITVTASAASDLEVVCSYEEVS